LQLSANAENEKGLAMKQSGFGSTVSGSLDSAQRSGTFAIGCARTVWTIPRWKTDKQKSPWRRAVGITGKISMPSINEKVAKVFQISRHGPYACHESHFWRTASDAARAQLAKDVHEILGRLSPIETERLRKAKALPRDQKSWNAEMHQRFLNAAYGVLGQPSSEVPGQLSLLDQEGDLE
jgi:hypothetical protein